MKENNEIYVFCQNIKKLRENNNLSKIEMAKIMGLSVMSLRKIENGELPPRIGVNTLFNLCKNFNIKPKKVFTACEKQTP